MSQARRMPHDRCWKMLKDADCVFSWSVANLRHDEISCKCLLYVSYCELMIFSLSMLKLLEFLIAPNIEPTPFFPEFHRWKIPVVIDFGKDFFPGADPDVDENYHELPISIWCGPWGSKSLRKGDVASFFLDNTHRPTEKPTFGCCNCWDQYGGSQVAVSFSLQQNMWTWWDYVNERSVSTVWIMSILVLNQSSACNALGMKLSQNRGKVAWTTLKLKELATTTLQIIERRFPFFSSAMVSSCLMCW